jgi:DNA-binding transcriptional ArsR family regulator
MRDGPEIALTASLMGDPVRATMLSLLMSGQALTAGELARETGVAPPTASGHLGLLLDGGLVAVEKQGRHRYFRLAGPDVAIGIEAMMELSENAGRRRFRPGPKDPEMRHARVCYDHLAGECGVDLFERLTRQQIVALEPGGLAVTSSGERRLAEFGVDLAALRRPRRPVCRACLDWSERRSHLAGTLGARLLDRIFELGWARRISGARALRFTARGEREFAALFR